MIRRTTGSPRPEPFFPYTAGFRGGRRHVGGFPGHDVASAVTATASAAQACEVTPYVGPGLALSPGAPTWSISACRTFGSFARALPHRCDFTSRRFTIRTDAGSRHACTNRPVHITEIGRAHVRTPVTNA